MSDVTRLSISLNKDLAERFDQLVRAKKFMSRSKAVEDLIQERLVQEGAGGDGPATGVLSMVYDHHRRELVNRLLMLQHDAHELIISSQHVHLDHHHCLEIVLVRGNTTSIRQLADAVRVLKGVGHVGLHIAAVADKQERRRSGH